MKGPASLIEWGGACYRSVVSRRILLIPVAVAVAATTAVVPVIPQLHVAFSSHAHCYCPEHERFEDLVVSDAASLSKALEDGEERAAGAGRGQPITRPVRQEVRFLACPLANLLVSQSAPQRFLLPVALAREASAPPPPVTQTTPSRRAVLARAPKHSPPTA